MRKRIHLLAAAALSAAGPLQAARAETGTVLDEVLVSDRVPRPLPAASTIQGSQLDRLRVGTSDTASLLRDTPGVTLYRAGGVSSLPSIHGLADDRVRVKVDGMDLVASCPNHMNPPLSYLDPTEVAAIRVYAGIAPVSLGGDSIGGTIVAQTPDPVFAEPGRGAQPKGEIGSYYASNGDAFSVNLAASVATEEYSLAYNGSTAQSQNYKAAGSFKTTTATGRPGHTLPLDEVGSTAYETRNQTLDFALRKGNHLLEATIGYQDIPYELYPNQRMDMLGNEQTSVNVRYRGRLEWGVLEAMAYYQRVTHFMDFGADKRFWYGAASGGPNALDGMPCSPIGPACAAGMPMNAEGKTAGGSVKAEMALSLRDLLRVGAELQAYRLDDWWPPSGAGMYPGTFWNIYNGVRDRAALFAEWESSPTPQWTTLLGVRYERVRMNTGAVRGYSTLKTAMGNQYADAAAFNSQDRERNDNNVDLVALARYRFDETKDIEVGFAHKVRSPNLYERYAWSTWSMAATMNNFVGDGNGYVGDVDLDPEQANTLSATFDWHSAEGDWGLVATPYYTDVTDYIDAVATAIWKPDAYNVLQYANQKARLFGIDVSGRMPLATTPIGRLGLKALVDYTRGKNLDTDSGLYNIMPLNAKLTLTQSRGGWDNAIELILVDSKEDVSEIRNEIRTAGYALVNLRASHSWTKVRLDVGIENLLDRMYYLPLGGAYLGQGTTMALNPVGAGAWGTAVPGMGRSVYLGLTFSI